MMKRISTDLASENFHKRGVSGMDKFLDPVGDEQTPTTIFSLHQKTDMIENISVSKCSGCSIEITSDHEVEEMCCNQCNYGEDPVEVVASTTIFSSHLENEMNMNEAIIESALETVNVDKAFKASYGCTKDGLTTLVPLGTPLASIRCKECGSSKFLTRIFDDEDDDRDIPNGTKMETVANMKPQFREHLKKDDKTGEFRVVIAPDDERGLGSFDPEAIMGYSQPEAIIGKNGALHRHYQFIDRNTGEWKQSKKNILESLIDRVREQRITENDIFADEPISATSVLVECDVPAELKVDINNGKGMESFYMDVPDMSRKVKVLVNIPETSMEAMKREQRLSTKTTILSNIAKKIQRIKERPTNTIDNFQINTVNKYIGAKPHPSNITYEDLASATKAMFWSATPESKESIKSKDGIYQVLVPQKERYEEFQKAMRTLNVSTVQPVEIPIAPKSSKTKGTSMVRFMGENSVFNDIPSYDNIEFNIYDNEPVTDVESEQMTSIKNTTYTVPSNNAINVQRHLASIAKTAKVESFKTAVNKLAKRSHKTKTNDNSIGVAQEATPSPLSNNQLS